MEMRFHIAKSKNQLLQMSQVAIETGCLDE
jgi:hypothetical protein